MKKATDATGNIYEYLFGNVDNTKLNQWIFNQAKTGKTILFLSFVRPDKAILST